jgi:hypothetical protein
MSIINKRSFFWKNIRRCFDIKNKKPLQYLVFVLLLILFNQGCRKFVDIEAPANQLVTGNVFSNDATAVSAVTGIYSTMMQDYGFASIAMTAYAGLSADELIDFSNSNDQSEFYFNSISQSNAVLKDFWGAIYQYIFAANAIIEGLSSSSPVGDNVKRQLVGEAKFIRAFCHFYLVNLFGDVPLILSTDYRSNSVKARTPGSEVYQQIILDLKDAQSLLLNDYSVSNNERLRPNRWAATALLSRVYLYTKDWTNAELEATSVINNTSLFDTVPMNNVFLKNSREAIWQLQPVKPDQDTWEGRFFILNTSPVGAGVTSVTLSDQLVRSFEAGDKRKTNWIDSFTTGSQTYFYPFKYKIKDGTSNAEYYMVLRLAEQYLIRAEARAELGKSNAVDDLNVIRRRAGLPDYSGGLDKTSLSNAIYNERRIEFFTEWGHRWLDLKRTKRIDAVMTAVTPLKGGVSWKSNHQLFPIPQSEIESNKNLIQNPGY